MTTLGMNSGIAQSVTAPAPGNAARSAVEALFRHRALFAATIGLVLFVTVLITLATTPAYESEMNILVRTGQTLQQEVNEQRINSEIDVLRSKDVADIVVDPDWTGTPLAQRSEIEIRQHEKDVLDFTRRLTVEPMRKSNVIRVAYVAGSPREATGTLDRLLKAFVARQGEIEHNSSSLASGEAQTANAMAQQELVDVAIAERPTYSAKPYRPLVLANLSIGLFTALFLAFSAVFFAEIRRDTVATPHELEVISSAHVLATVPWIARIEPGFAMGGRSTGSPRPRPVPGDTPLPEESNRGDLEHQPAFPDTLRPAMTFGALALSPALEKLEKAESENALHEEASRINRATLLPRKQLDPAPSTPHTEPEIPASIPVEIQAEIVSTKSQPITAKVAEPVKIPAFIIEPIDPNHRPNRALSDPSIPARSRLTPSQRAQLRRPSAPSEGRAAYVTYTIDPKTKR
jgi:capsular polysaccharide biosynthesis protein